MTSGDLDAVRAYYEVAKVRDVDRRALVAGLLDSLRAAVTGGEVDEDPARSYELLGAERALLDALIAIADQQLRIFAQRVDG